MGKRVVEPSVRVDRADAKRRNGFLTRGTDGFTEQATSAFPIIIGCIENQPGLGASPEQPRSQTALAPCPESMRIHSMDFAARSMMRKHQLAVANAERSVLLVGGGRRFHLRWSAHRTAEPFVEVLHAVHPQFVTDLQPIKD